MDARPMDARPDAAPDRFVFIKSNPLPAPPTIGRSEAASWIIFATADARVPTPAGGPREKARGSAPGPREGQSPLEPIP